nr:hypothetical protein [Tanacetum cinerariifolium]
MSSITAQQTKLDLELVPKENRLDIGKCNGRIPRGLTPKEPTFQVVLDAIAITPCYLAFLITADVPKVYMHQFWNSVYKHDPFYRFKLDKKKIFKPTLEVFRDIFQICQRVHGRDFDALPSEEDIVSFLREIGHTGEINSLNDVVVDQMHQRWRTFAALINRGLFRKTSSFDKLRLSRAQILWGMYYQKNVDYMELLWEDFIYQIENRVFKKKENIYYPRFTKAIIHHFLIQDKTLSCRNKIGMHTSKDDYLINSLRFVSAKESTQIYGYILPKCLTSPTMKESKAYKTYLDYGTGAVPPKIARKFKKASPSKKEMIYFLEPHVKTKSKRKEKVDVTRGKGIELLSEVALTEEAQMKEVRKKILRDFHKLHPSGSCTIAKKPPRVDKITPPIINDNNDENDSKNEGNDDENKSDDDKTPYGGEKDSDSEQDTNGSESDSESDQQEYEEEVKDDDDEDDDDKFEENLKITQEQVVEDAHVMVTTVAKESEVLDASVSHSSDLASKFFNFLYIHPNDAKIVSPLDVHVHHETTPAPPPTIKTTNIPSSIPKFALVFRFNDTVIALEQDVVELKKDPLHTQVTALLPQILPEEVSNFASLVIDKMIAESLNQVNLAKASSQRQSTYVAAATLTEFKLKKILIDKIKTSESYLTAPEHRECYEGLIKSYNLNKDFFSSYDVYSLKQSRQDKDKD